MSDKPKKPRSEKQIAWAKQLGKNSAETKKQKNELNILNKSKVNESRNESENSSSINTSNYRVCNKYIYITVGIITFIGVFYYQYKHNKPLLKSSPVNNTVIDTKTTTKINSMD